MSETIFWTRFGPLLAEQLEQIKNLTDQVEHWKTECLKLQLRLDPQDLESKDLEAGQPADLEAGQPADLEAGQALCVRKRKDGKRSAKKIKIQTCGCCHCSQTPQWRKNNGDPEWGDQICNACWSRQKRKSRVKHT